MRRIILLLLFVLSSVAALKAEQVIDKERYTITIPFDTIYFTERYDFYVKIKSRDSARVYFCIPAQNRKELIGIGVKDSLVYFSISTKRNWNASGDSATYNLQILIVFSDTTFAENVGLYVKAFSPTMFKIPNVIDSLSEFISSDPRFVGLKPLIDSRDGNKQFGQFSSYLMRKFNLYDSIGQLSIALIVDPKGRIIAINILTNTYNTVDLATLNTAIKLYRFKKDSPELYKFPPDPFAKNNVSYSVYFKTIQLMRDRRMYSETNKKYDDFRWNNGL